MRKLFFWKSQRTQRKDDAGEITEDTEDTQRNTGIEITKGTKNGERPCGATGEAPSQSVARLAGVGTS